MTRLPEEPAAVLGLDRLSHARGDLCHLFPDRGKPCGALALGRIGAPVPEVWQVLSEIEKLPDRIPMIHRTKVDGDRLEMQLRFKIALLSAKFGFEARADEIAEKRLVLSYLSGEPRDIEIRFDLAPLDPATTGLYVGMSFDIESLGWLVSFFLKNHPEIRYGVYPGCVLSLLDSFREEAERRPRRSAA
jgi:carbon monoxide dehydrogenase subunit G